MTLFHRHVWKVVEKTEHPSPVELFRKHGGTNVRGYGDGFFERPVIVTYRCDSCLAEKVERV